MKKILLTLFIAFCFCSCARTVYVPVESVRTEYTTKLERDSVYLRDSVFVRQNADTVFTYQYKYLYRTKLQVDTVLRVDTIQVPYEVTHTVTEKERGFFHHFGLMTILLLIIIVTIKFSKYFRSF